MRLRLAALVIATVAALGFSRADAVLIFGDAQNGDFGGDTAEDLTADHNATSIRPTRRAVGGGTPPAYSMFYDNIDFVVDAVDTGSVFGGIDSLLPSANPHMQANKRTVTQATFYANAGTSSPFTAPSGTFSQSFVAGDIIAYSFDVIFKPSTSGTDPRDTSLYDLSMSFDGGSTFLPLASVDGTVVPSSELAATVSGTFEVPAAATDFLVRATVTNPDPGNDQAGLDNIMLDLNPVLGDANGDGIVDIDDFEIIRANFGRDGNSEGVVLMKTDGDLVDDNVVDFLDYGQWKQAAPPELGDLSHLLGGDSTVPEPSTLALLLLSGFAVVAVKRRS